jgi:hypothetical protein
VSLLGAAKAMAMAASKSAAAKINFLIFSPPKMICSRSFSKRHILKISLFQGV